MTTFLSCDKKGFNTVLNEKVEITSQATSLKLKTLKRYIIFERDKSPNLIFVLTMF